MQLARVFLLDFQRALEKQNIEERAAAQQEAEQALALESAQMAMSERRYGSRACALFPSSCQHVVASDRSATGAGTKLWQ
jgi:hypothetical protein